MGFWQRITGIFSASGSEQRSASVRYGLNEASLVSLLTANDSGPVQVSEETALSLATVFRCVDVLSSSFANLPWELYQNTGTVSIPAIGHPVRPVMKMPDSQIRQTSFVWRKTLLTHALLWGNAYARIIRNGVYRPTRLKIYHPREVLVLTDLYRDEVTYRFPDSSEVFGPADVIHLRLFSLDGIVGRSVIRQAAESFKLPMQSRRFLSKLSENGARPSGIISHPQRLSNEAKKNLRSSWFSEYGGENQAGKTAVLDEGMKFEKVGMSPVDAQTLELLNLSREEICALFGVPQHMAGILRQSTNNNIEHQGLEYLAYSLRPHVVNFQQEFDAKVLRAQEVETFATRFDLDSLQLVDINSKKEWVQTLRNAGIVSANEVRDMINLNPYEGGDTYYIQGAMLPIDPATGRPVYPPKEATKTAKPAPGVRSLNGHAHEN